MSPEVDGQDTGTDAGPDLSAELGEMMGGPPVPVEGVMPPDGQVAPPADPIVPVAPAPAIEEFDIDGRKVNKDALFQTYRQFSHLQNRHQELKPYVELMQEIGITPDQVPQFRAWIAGQLKPSPSVAPAETPLDQEAWYQEIAETFPQFATILKAEISARQAAEARFTAMEQQLTGFTSAIQDRQRQEQAVGILGKAADHINAMMTDFPRLQDQEVRGAFLRWMWDEQKPGAKIADPKYLRGMYLVYDEAALAQQWEAKAKASQTAHAATVARGFAETGAPRPAGAGAEDVLTKELQELMSV